MLISELNISFTIDKSTFGIINPQLSPYPIRWYFGITKNENPQKQSLLMALKIWQCNSNKLSTYFKV